ncbi:MAG: hypothetical protein BWX66_00383 [Deltaproteobacteria bacterium ADurb.Bin058]|jgi:hypothetical protein|nr:MAG: hypothetical protein BWX66_00383 [Deltaproteobacteria bacterium ADurb.Bin058]
MCIGQGQGRGQGQGQGKEETPRVYGEKGIALSKLPIFKSFDKVNPGAAAGTHEKTNRT